MTITGHPLANARGSVCLLRRDDFVDDVQPQLAADYFVAHVARAQAHFGAAREREARAELFGAEYLYGGDARVNRVLPQARQPRPDERRGDVLQLEFVDADARVERLLCLVEFEVESRVGPALEVQAADERRGVSAAEGHGRGDAPVAEVHGCVRAAGLGEQLHLARALPSPVALRKWKARRLRLRRDSLEQ